MVDLAGLVAIVTGSSKGLGRVEAIELARAGAKVVVIARNLDEVQAVVRQIVDDGGEAIGLSCDVVDRVRVHEVVQEVAATYGRIDILINNAQYIPGPKAIEEWAEDEHRRIWESGFLGTFNFMVECLPLLKVRGGKIMNTCSGAGHGYLWGTSSYGATKEAIRTLTRHAAKEWGKYGICVNVLAPATLSPGAVDCMTPEMEQEILSMFAIKRWSDPVEEIAKVVVFLVGPNGSYATGNTISLDGGAAMVV